MIDVQYCMSSYLTFRYIANPMYSWKEDCKPSYPNVYEGNQIPIYSTDDISNFIKGYIKKNYSEDSAILLSGGIDSAIIASYLPEGTKAYTIRFVAEKAIDESEMAAKYANTYKLDHRIVDVYWSDYIEYTPMLMKNKKSPLHPVEVGLYKAALTARNDRVTKFFIGNGADSTFGGMDKLLSKDWTFNEFIKRYTFLCPEIVLKSSVSMEHIYLPYKRGKYIDYISFLKNVHGIGIIQAFENAIGSAGCGSLEPFECMKLAIPLDINEIRKGNSKYMLRELFSQRYPKIEVPEKIPFARPMDIWLRNWEGTKRPEFTNYDLTDLTGEQKWLIYCLEMFLNQIDI